MIQKKKQLTFVADAGSVTGLSETDVLFALVAVIVCISIFSDIFSFVSNKTPARKRPTDQRLLFPTVHLFLTHQRSGNNFPNYHYLSPGEFTTDKTDDDFIIIINVRSLLFVGCSSRSCGAGIKRCWLTKQVYQ